MFSRNSPSRCQDWIGFVSQYHIDHFDKLRGQIGFVSQKPIRALAGRLSAFSLRSSEAKLGSFRKNLYAFSPVGFQHAAFVAQTPNWVRFATNNQQLATSNQGEIGFVSQKT